MNVAKLLDKRRKHWTELERLCESMEMRGSADAVSSKHGGAAGIARFSTLYRAACADLALADAYQLPPNTVAYLHRLVARAHNQLYRTQPAAPGGWARVLLYEAPQRIFSDNCVRVAAFAFFGLFTLAMMMGAAEEQFPNFAENVCGSKMLEQTQDSFQEPLKANPEEYSARAAWYIQHNTGIGLKCFAYGPLLIPCIFTLGYNAVVLGATFGYMSRPGMEGSENFFEFVTAHGPFELTAIALSAGAGLRLGMGLFYTGGLARTESMRQAGYRSVPIMAASAAMFILAALTEGCLSPSSAPYIVKAGFSVFSSALITLYFVILGFPRSSQAETSLVRSARYEDLVDSQEQTSEPHKSASGQEAFAAAQPALLRGPDAT
ncbi:MAG: stage II sporulation protein M [Planctomycetota bacterium]